MDTQRGVELLLGRAHFYRNRNTLDNLGGVGADHVNAHHDLGFLLDDQLHEAAFIAPRKGVLEGFEGRFVQVDLAAVGPGFGFGHTDHGNRGLAEYRVGHVLVVRAGRLIGIKRARQRHALHQGDGRQFDPVGDIADGVDVVGGGLRIVVDDDAAPGVALDTDGFQAQPVDIGLAPGAVHHGIHLERRAVGQRQGYFGARLCNICDVGFDPKVNALLDDLRRQVMAHVVVEAAQDLLAAIKHRGRGPQPIEDAGEFDGDITAADDGDALGHLGEMKNLVRGDGVFDAGDIGQRRAPAGGDQDGLGGDFFTADIQRMRIDKSRPGAIGLDAGIAQDRAVDGFQAVDFLVLGGDQAGPGKRRAVDGPAEALGVFEILAEVAGVDHQFFRHAAADHAGAAEAVFLGNADFGPEGGRHAAGAHATRAGADYKQIIVVVIILGGHRTWVLVFVSGHYICMRPGDVSRTRHHIFVSHLVRPAVRLGPCVTPDVPRSASAG